MVIIRAKSMEKSSFWKNRSSNKKKKEKKTRTHIYKRNHLKWGKKIRPTVRNLVYGEREKKEIAMEICKLQMEIAKFI